MPIRLYYYGVWLTTTGKVRPFVCKRYDKIPGSATYVDQGIMTCERAKELANNIKSLSNSEPSKYKFLSGDVVIYADKQGQHTAIVLDKGINNSTMLFITSNPNWGIFPQDNREITKEEEVLLGYPDKGRTSYFVPVIRPNKFVVETGKVYPKYRIKELITEFEV